MKQGESLFSFFFFFFNTCDADSSLQSYGSLRSARSCGGMSSWFLRSFSTLSSELSRFSFFVFVHVHVYVYVYVYVYSFYCSDGSCAFDISTPGAYSLPQAPLSMDLAHVFFFCFTGSDHSVDHGYPFAT